MNFTNSPYEKMMKEKPRPPRRGTVSKPPKGSPCRNCGYWNGAPCIEVCYRDVILSREKEAVTSGIGGHAKSADFVGGGGATERADFGCEAAEGAERSLQRRDPK